MFACGGCDGIFQEGIPSSTPSISPLYTVNGMAWVLRSLSFTPSRLAAPRAENGLLCRGCVVWLTSQLGHTTMGGLDVPEKTL